MRRNIVELPPIAGQETSNMNHSSVLKRVGELKERSRQQFQGSWEQDEQSDSRSQRPFSHPKPHIDPHNSEPSRDLTIVHESNPRDLEMPQNGSFTEIVLDLDAPHDSKPVSMPVRSPVDANGLLRSPRLLPRFNFLNSGTAGAESFSEAPRRTPS